MKLKGWAISVGSGRRKGFSMDPLGRPSSQNLFIYAFYQSRTIAKGVLAYMKETSPKYVRGAKVVPVTLELREATRIKGKKP